MNKGLSKSLVLSFVVFGLLLVACPVSADPLDTWYWRNPLPAGNDLYGVTYGAGTFVAVGDWGTILQSEYLEPEGTFFISGTVTYNGSSLGNVTLSLSGPVSRTTSTESNGTYSFTGLPNGTYTITPNLSGYTFNPPSRSVTISVANVTGQNFVAWIGPITCSTWQDVITKYQAYVNDQASWEDVIICYQEYAS